MNFLALSQAPPPAVIEMATNRPVTMTPSSMAPSDENAADLPPIARITTNSTTDDSTGNSDGTIISFIAARVSRSTHLPYSGFPVPSMMPGISLNCRRTSTTTELAARPTAVIPMEPNKKGSIPPMNRPTTTKGLVKEKSSVTPAKYPKDSGWPMKNFRSDV